MKNGFVILLLMLVAATGWAQRKDYAVYGVQTNPMTGWYSPVTLDTLQDAKTLLDIYPKYRPAWVAKYHSVKISSTCGSTVRTAEGPDHRLTSEQLELLRNTTPDCATSVRIHYTANNDLSPNPPRTMDFSVQVVPIFEAKFPGGMSQLQAHLKTEIVDVVPTMIKEPVELVKVQFTINEAGEVVDTRLSVSSGQTDVDRFIQQTICSMPLWRPARDIDGQAIPQEFEFSMGSDMLRCDFYAY